MEEQHLAVDPPMAGVVRNSQDGASSEWTEKLTAVRDRYKECCLELDEVAQHVSIIS